jgi:hypothetical protein
MLIRFWVDFCYVWGYLCTLGGERKGNNFNVELLESGTGE